MTRAQSLPARPSLKYLKKLAKQQVAALRRQGKTTSLAEAQFALARSYGFPSWRKLKTYIEQVETQARQTRILSQNAASSEIFNKVMKAITNRNAQDLAQLLAAAPGVVNQAGPHPRWSGRPQPLHVAIESDNYQAFEMLLDAGANVDGQNQYYDGWTPLMISIHWNRKAMREELIRRGAMVDLIAALMLGDDRRVARLLKDPVALRGPFPNNATPLHFARTVKSARLLISLGADVGAKDKYGKTAPERWIDAKPPSAALTRLADSLGAKPGLDIFKAVECGRLVQVRRFLANGADVNARFPDGANQTLLHVAAFGGNLAMVKLLVGKGADLNALDREHNNTPAGWARFALKAFNRYHCEAVAEYLEGQINAGTKSHLNIRGSQAVSTQLRKARGLS
jgi:ankyrin repeat protein